MRAGGAVPATVALVDGEAWIGLDDAALARVAGDDDGGQGERARHRHDRRRGGVGATTVASTAHLAARAGIAVFATGGLGGVHRDARDTWDESADLMTLSRTPVLVVCAGVKSILDVAATLERLESLNIAVLGYRTDRFPGFYLADSGHPLDWRVESAAEVAAILRARRELGTDAYGLVLANPIAAGDELDRELHDRVLAGGLAAARAAGVAARTSRRSCSTTSTERRPGPPWRRTSRWCSPTPAGRAGGGRVRGHAGVTVATGPGTARVVCLGDVMVDVVARLSGPLATGSDSAATTTLRGGGSAANTACWLEHAGLDVALVGRVGADMLGAWTVEQLGSSVARLVQTDPGTATGTCVVLVAPDGERTMVPDAGANATLRPDHLRASDFTPGAHLHVSGYALFGAARTAALRAFSLARDAGMTISVGAASEAPLRELGADSFFGLIGRDVLLFANRAEATVLTGYR